MLIPEVKIRTAQEKTTSKVCPISGWIIRSNEIIEIKKELINLIKSKNLIDVRTPFFLNTKLDINKTSNLVELNKRIKKIDAIDLFQMD